MTLEVQNTMTLWRDMRYGRQPECEIINFSSSCICPQTFFRIARFLSYDHRQPCLMIICYLSLDLFTTAGSRCPRGRCACKEVLLQSNLAHIASRFHHVLIQQRTARREYINVYYITTKWYVSRKGWIRQGTYKHLRHAPQTRR